MKTCSDAANLRTVLSAGNKTPSATKLPSRANSSCVPDIKMYTELRSRSVHFLGICEKRAAAQCQILIFHAGKTRFFPEVATAQRFYFWQVPKKCTNLDINLLYSLILGTYSKFARKNKLLALGMCFLQPCSSAGRRFATSGSRLHYYQRMFRFHNDEYDETPCKLHSTENPCSFGKYSTTPSQNHHLQPVKTSKENLKQLGFTEDYHWT